MLLRISESSHLIQCGCIDFILKLKSCPAEFENNFTNVSSNFKKPQRKRYHLSVFVFLKPISYDGKMKNTIYARFWSWAATIKCLDGVWRIKKESNRGSSNEWAKTLYREYLHYIASFRATEISPQSKSFKTTSNVENKFSSAYKTLENTIEIKLMIRLSEKAASRSGKSRGGAWGASLYPNFWFVCLFVCFFTTAAFANRLF